MLASEQADCRALQLAQFGIWVAPSFTEAVIVPSGRLVGANAQTEAAGQQYSTPRDKGTSTRDYDESVTVEVLEDAPIRHNEIDASRLSQGYSFRTQDGRGRVTEASTFGTKPGQVKRLRNVLHVPRLEYNTFCFGTRQKICAPGAPWALHYTGDAFVIRKTSNNTVWLRAPVRLLYEADERV